MARAGMYKSDVKNARDALLAKGKKPSIDAERVELGNTGSKTTIHKYLRELEGEDGAVHDKRKSLSDVLADFVERLAAGLQEDADSRYAARVSDIEANAQEQRMTLRTAQAESARLAAHLNSLEAAIQQVELAQTAALEGLTHESTARKLAEQRADGLSQRLAENEAHRRSLEEKHRHARDALEHYRQAAREQRESEMQRHEQQVQQLQSELRQANQRLSIKYDEATQLHREGARLIAELTHARKSQLTAERSLKQQTQEAENLRAQQVNHEQLRVQIAERDGQIAALQDRLDTCIGHTRRNAGLTPYA